MNNPACKIILKHASIGANLRQDFLSREASYIDALGIMMAYTIARGNKILLCGNGGSAADCQHLAAEFVNRFQINRPPLPALAMTTDTSILSAIGNDFSFDEIFSKQISALGKHDDFLILISTSGSSRNILLAAETAQKKQIASLALTGSSGGQLQEICDFTLMVPSTNTPIIQELHITIGHLLCALTDYYLFENVAALSCYLNDKTPLPLKRKFQR